VEYGRTNVTLSWINTFHKPKRESSLLSFVVTWQGRGDDEDGSGEYSSHGEQMFREDGDDLEIVYTSASDFANADRR